MNLKRKFSRDINDIGFSAFEEYVYRAQQRGELEIALDPERHLIAEFCGPEIIEKITTKVDEIPLVERDSTNEFNFRHAEFITDNPNYPSKTSEIRVYEDTAVVVLERSYNTKNELERVSLELAGPADSEIIRFIESFRGEKLAPPPRNEDVINIIGQNANGFVLDEFQVNLPKFTEFELEDCYNDSFKPINDKVVARIQSGEEDVSFNRSGIILFHGDPGTGKTTYLRHLMRSIKNRNVIYLPPDMTTALSQPQFFQFLAKECKGSVIFIEDAENVLMERGGGQSQAVSNLLNIADGILGDILNITLVCTFNVPHNEIDPALMRPGRMIARYEFKALDVEKAQSLVDKRYGEGSFTVVEPMSLAEIFLKDDMPEVSASQKAAVGFDTD